MPSGKKRKRHKMATHKRKKRLRKNRHKKRKQGCVVVYKENKYNPKDPFGTLGFVFFIVHTPQN